MTTASDRINLIGLTLGDAHLIADQLRTRSQALQEEDRKLSNLLAALHPDCPGWAANKAILSAIRNEREQVLSAREALSAAIAETLNFLP